VESGSAPDSSGDAAVGRPHRGELTRLPSALEFLNVRMCENSPRRLLGPGLDAAASASAEAAAPATGMRSCLVVLLATALTAQEGSCGLPVGSRGIGDRGPPVSRQLAYGEPLQVVHDNRRLLDLDPPSVCSLAMNTASAVMDTQGRGRIKHRSGGRDLAATRRSDAPVTDSSGSPRRRMHAIPQTNRHAAKWALGRRSCY
jgi:hypothetical protein